MNENKNKADCPVLRHNYLQYSNQEQSYNDNLLALLHEGSSSILLKELSREQSNNELEKVDKSKHI